MPLQGLHICHLSLLNPAIHSRIFFKMAASQVLAGYKVTIVAQDAAKAPYEREGVQIIPLGVFGRLSWRRFWSLKKIASIAKKLGADIYQVHTVELLPLARKLKDKLAKAKVVYDMHEDYVANILFADYYGELSRKNLAQRVRNVQNEFPKWGDGLILAEDCFQGLIAFDPDYTAVVRNKYQAPRSTTLEDLRVPSGMPFMLFTGTIAENWGIWKAVELWERLNQIQPLGWVVAGHGQDKKLILELEARVKASGMGDRFVLAGGTEYLPFEVVVKYIQACTFGLALYELKENIMNRIPTKFYEFMAHQKPLLFSSNSKWEELNAAYGFGKAITWPLNERMVQEIAHTFLGATSPFFAKPIPEAAWSWETEAKAMLDLMHKLMP